MSTIREFAARFRELDPRIRLRWGIGLAVFLSLALLYSFANDQVKKIETLRIAKEGEIAELLALKQRFSEASAIAQRNANMQTAVRTEDSPAKLVEDTGIKGKSLQVKPLKSEERGGVIEEAAEIKIDSITPNETINLLYRLEYGAKPATVRRALLKTRFEDPSRLDLTMIVTLQKATAKR